MVLKALRNENSATIKIQSLMRGHLARVRQGINVRRELEGLQQVVIRREKGKILTKNKYFQNSISEVF